MTVPARVAVVVYPDVDELDAVGVLAPLLKAAELGAPVEPVLVAAAPAPTGAAGLTFPAARDLAGLASAAAVVVPGGRGAGRAALDVRLCAALASAGERGVRLYGVCTGVVVLAAAGLVRGRRVAVHARKHDLLRGSGAREVGAGLVRDGDLTTVGGAPADRLKGLDIALAVLEDLCPDVVGPLTQRLEVRAP